MIDLNTVTAALVLCVGAPIILGYARVALTDRGIAGHMATSIACVIAAYVLRTVYWDALWREVFVIPGGLLINNLTNALFIYGCWRGLRALHLMIPDDDRPLWPLWRAWLYPPWRLALWLRAAVRRLARRR